MKRWNKRPILSTLVGISLLSLGFLGGGGGGGDGPIAIEAEGLTPPILYSPANGAVLDNGCEDRSDSEEWDFDWSDVLGASKYHLYVIHEGAQLPIIDVIVPSSSYHYSDPGAYIADINRFDWTWMVSAGDDDGQWSEWSEVRYFDVEPVNTDCEPVEVFITGSWVADDFSVTDPSDPLYDPANPEFDGKVFGVAPSAGSTTIQLRVDTDSAVFFPVGYTWDNNGTPCTLAHDWYGYSDVMLVNDPYTFGTATWTNSGILTALIGPNDSTAALWTDVDITSGVPSRLSFRMFGTGDGLTADVFVGSRWMSVFIARAPVGGI